MSDFFELLLIFFLVIGIKRIKSQSEFYSHNILEQYSCYNKDKKFNNSFIDFMNYKVYYINKNNIIHKNQENNDFNLRWSLEEKKKISIECINETCIEIELSEHKVISFDFEKLLSTDGGIIAYILILYGLFSLKRGFIYINLSFIFYGSFSFILFIREICQFLKITGNLSDLYKGSEILSHFVFYSTLIISILYGFVCHFSNILKYISLGFVEGIIFSKIIFYLVVSLKILNNNLLLHYFLLLLFCSTVNMVVFGFLKNKYPKITILIISNIAGFGIIFGVYLINGSLPFIPYLILSSKYKEKSLYDKLLDNNLIGYYMFLLLILVFCGVFWNNSSFNKLKNKNNIPKINT